MPRSPARGSADGGTVAVDRRGSKQKRWSVRGPSAEWSSAWEQAIRIECVVGNTNGRTAAGTSDSVIPASLGAPSQASIGIHPAAYAAQLQLCRATLTCLPSYMRTNNRCFALCFFDFRNGIAQLMSNGKCCLVRYCRGDDPFLEAGVSDRVSACICNLTVSSRHYRHHALRPYPLGLPTRLSVTFGAYTAGSGHSGQVRIATGSTRCTAAGWPAGFCRRAKRHGARFTWWAHSQGPSFAGLKNDLLPRHGTFPPTQGASTAAQSCDAKTF